MKTIWIVICAVFLFSFSEVASQHVDESLNGDTQKSLVFVILTHAKDAKSSLLWKRSYDSVRQFYPEHPIVIIDDNSPLPLSIEGLDNITLIRGEHPGAGELLPYLYFLKHKWADRMVFLHDSMFLIRPFTDDELNHLVRPHWHFSDHYWDGETPIEELLSHLGNSEDLIDYKRNREGEWVGCFGVASIIHIRVLEDLEAHYGFTSRLKNVIHTRSQRMALERVFGILLAKDRHYLPESPSNFGSIHDYPKAFIPNLNEEEIDDIQSFYPGAIIKTWQGR